MYCTCCTFDTIILQSEKYPYSEIMISTSTNTSTTRRLHSWWTRRRDSPARCHKDHRGILVAGTPDKGLETGLHALTQDFFGGTARGTGISREHWPPPRAGPDRAPGGHPSTSTCHHHREPALTLSLARRRPRSLSLLGVDNHQRSPEITGEGHTPSTASRCTRGNWWESGRAGWVDERGRSLRLQTKKWRREKLPWLTD